ncbi:hypothetical protein V2K88_13960 [Pseudomonas alliivorans]|nr:hypothetical protein [Pseudomonas alliivorans]
MNHLDAAIRDYQCNVECAVEFANQMLEALASNRSKLMELNQILGSLSAISNELVKDDDHFFSIQSALLGLKASILKFNSLTNDAMQTLSGRLGRCLDELREFSEYLNNLPNEKLEAIKPLLTECQIAVDGVCTKLIDCSITDPFLLKMLKSARKT